MEHRLADQPQKAVQAGPELARIDECLRTVAEEVEGIDAVAKAQDQSADDHGGDDGRKHLCDHRHGSLHGVLVLLRRGLRGILRHAFDAGDADELLIERLDVVADDHLELTALRKATLGRGQSLDAGHIGLGLVVEHEPHPCHAVGHGGYILLTAHQLQQFRRVCRILAHVSSSWFV